MFTDYQSTSQVDGVITFPEWVVQAEPVPASEQKETVVLTGSSTQNTSVGGSG